MVHFGKLLVLLNIKRAETGVVVTQFLFLLTVTAAALVGRTVADTLFLSRYDLSRLMYMYLAIALVLTGAGVLYQTLLNRFQNRWLGSYMTLAVAILVMIIRIFLPIAPSWIFPAVYIGFDVLNFILIINFWRMFTATFTSQQVKRLSGLIGSAGLLGPVLSGFAVSSFVHNIGTDNLITLYGLLVLTATPLCWVTERLLPSRRLRQKSDSKKKTWLQTTQQVIKIRHIKLMAGLVFLGTIALVFTDYQFKMIVSSYFRNESLAGFLGMFLSLTAGIAFVVQLALTPIVLARSGILISFLVLPFFLLLGSFGILLAPVLFSVLIAKGADKIFSDTIHTSAGHLMYVPLSSRLRDASKVFIDALVRPLSKGFAAILLIACSSFLSPPLLSLVVIPVLAIFILTVIKLKKAYVQSLMATMRTGLLQVTDLDSASVDADLLQVFTLGLKRPEPEHVLYCLSILEQAPGFDLSPYVQDLLNHPRSAVRIQSLELVSRIKPVNYAEMVLPLLEDKRVSVRKSAVRVLAQIDPSEHRDFIWSLLQSPEVEIQGAAISALLKVGNKEDFSEIKNQLRVLLNSHSWEKRAEAADIFGYLKDKAFNDSLISLLSDPHDQVRHSALKATKAIADPLFISPLLIMLTEAVDINEVLDTITAFPPDRVLDKLDTHFLKTDASDALKSHVPDIIARLRTKEGYILVLTLYRQENMHFRERAVTVLSTMNQYIRLDHAIETTTTSLALHEMEEYINHSSSLVICRSFCPDSEIVITIEELRREAFARIFKLLGILFDPVIVTTAYDNLQNPDLRIRSNALEILDQTLTGNIRTELVRILEKDPVTWNRESVETICFENEMQKLTHSDEPWLRCCAEFATQTASEVSCRDDDQTSTPGQDEIRKVNRLRECFLFHKVPGYLLSRISRILKPARFEAGETILHKGDSVDRFYFVDNDALISRETVLPVDISRYPGILHFLSALPGTEHIQAETECMMLYLDERDFIHILSSSRKVKRLVLQSTTKYLRDLMVPNQSFNSFDNLRSLSEAFIDRQEPGNTSLTGSCQPDQAVLLIRVMLLKEIALFKELTNDELFQLAATMEEMEFEQGVSIFELGDFGESLFAILTGSVKIHKGTQILSILKDREYFGEMAVIDREPRSASATAVQNTTVFKLSQDSFWTVLENNHHMARQILKVLGKRIQMIGFTDDL